MRRYLPALLAALLAVAALSLAGCQAKVVTSPGGGTPIDTVTAQGTGKALTAPDKAEMTFGVSITDSDAKRALDRASTTARAITDALRSAGIAKDDIQTAGITLYPQRDNSNHVTGYSSSISVRAVARDFATLGAVIEAATKAGATEIGGPSFMVSDDNPANDKALSAAVDDARKRAGTMAKAAGKSVGRIVSVSEAGVQSPGPIYEQRFMASAKLLGAAAPPVEPGSMETVAQVTVVFELK